MTAMAAHDLGVSTAAPEQADFQKPEFRLDPETNRFILTEDPRFRPGTGAADAPAERDGKRTGKERARDLLESVLDGLMDFLASP